MKKLVEKVKPTQTANVLTIVCKCGRNIAVDANLVSWYICECGRTYEVVESG